MGRRNPQPNIQHQQTRLYRFPLPLPPPPPTQSTADVTDLSELERIQILGHGSAGGKVYKVRHRKTSKLYALKVNHCHDQTVRRKIIREMEIMKKTESPYIVKCYGIFERGEKIYLVLEYMDGGSLEQRKSSEIMSERFLSNVARQVSEGLTYLHRHKIVHRDIKPSNLLINRKQEVKIAEFGVSRILDTCAAYMSPERFDPETYGGRYYDDGYAGDIWSLGLSLLECFIGHFPFQKADWPAICYGNPLPPPPTASAQFRSFITCCMHKDARTRWTAAQLLAHPFLICNNNCPPHTPSIPMQRFTI